MAVNRVLITIPAVSGIPEDAITNTWAYTTLDTDQLTPGHAMQADLVDFYEAWATYRGALHDWDSATCRIYDLADTEPRTPFINELLGLSATAAATTLPSEVALCLSFQASPFSGAVQARRRGRVYLGTFATVAANSTDGRPNNTMVNLLSAAGGDLLAASQATSGAGSYIWCVVSMAGGGPAEFAAVEEGWVDNAWDTQRRRGLGFTNKNRFP